MNRCLHDIMDEINKNREKSALIRDASPLNGGGKARRPVVLTREGSSTSLVSKVEEMGENSTSEKQT